MLDNGETTGDFDLLYDHGFACHLIDSVGDLVS